MSEIITNKLTGKTSAGDVTITSGASTMKLQKGICTGWTNYDAYGSSQKGSFNQSSLTDNGNGDFTMTFTNNSSSVDDRLVLSLPLNSRNGAESADNRRGGNDTSQHHSNNATSTIRMRYFYGARSDSNGDNYDLDGHYFGKIAELA